MKTHYLTNEMSISKIKGVAACGIFVSREDYGDDMSSKRADVTCGNCLRSRIYRKVKDQQKCKHCGRIVGCDYRDRKHKCRICNPSIEQEKAERQSTR